MSHLTKLTFQFFTDELQKIAMSEGIITKAINASHNKAMNLLGQSPINAANISAAAKKLKQSSNIRLGLVKRRGNVGYNFLKTAETAFDDEMQRLLQTEGIDKIMDHRALTRVTNMNRSGTNVGMNDEYNPTELESTYGQSL